MIKGFIIGRVPTERAQWCPPAKRFALYIRDNWSCQFCGWKAKTLADVAKLTLDHWFPRFHGGSDKAHNLLTACFACNNTKDDMHGNEFVTDPILLERLERQMDLPLSVETIQVGRLFSYLFLGVFTNHQLQRSRAIILPILRRMLEGKLQYFDISRFPALWYDKELARPDIRSMLQTRFSLVYKKQYENY